MRDGADSALFGCCLFSVRNTTGSGFQFSWIDPTGSVNSVYFDNR
jgi:hypothetical protein